MISEAIETVERMAVNATDAKVVVIDKNDPSKTWLYKNTDGSLTSYETVKPPRAHRLTTIPSFAAAFARYAPDETASVFVCLNEVVAVLDDGAYRCSLIRLPIAPSPVFQTLQNMTGALNQKQLLGVLRHDLQPCKITPDSLELSIANLRWEFHDVTESAIGTVKSTMGRNVNAEVKGEGAIPLEITVAFEAFPALADSLPSGIVSVDCSVSLNAEEKTISVRAFPGQLDMAKASAVEKLRKCIADAIKDDMGRVFAGTV